MNNSEKPMDHAESLAVITAMIRNTQGNFHQSSFYFIIWGVVIAAANIGHYLLLMHTNYEHPYIVWLAVIPTWLVAALYARKQQTQARVTTVMDKVIGMIWIGFGVSTFLLVIPGNILNAYFNPIILLMAAAPTLVTGYIIKEKPLMIGAIMLWVFGSLCFFVDEEIRYLIAAAAILIGYVIPGLIMRKKSK